MKKLRDFIESKGFQNTILAVIIINSIIMGLQTSSKIVEATNGVLEILDMICLGIFVVELVLKLIAYGGKFFTDGWNIFDTVIVGMSFVSGLQFFAMFRIFRVLKVFRSLKALKSLRSLKLVSWLGKLRNIITAIGKSIPGIVWSAALLLLTYYVFAIIGVTMFGEKFYDWFGTIGKAMYTLFQVMTLESWSMGISRPVMEVFPYAWLYFVPFVLIASFIMMNVVVGIVVNAISEVTDETKREEMEELPSDEKALREELAQLKEHIAKVEAILDRKDN